MKLLLYCTKNKWRLFFDKVKQIFTLGKIKSNNDLNGKIVAECDFEVERMEDYFDNHSVEEFNKDSQLYLPDFISYITKGRRHINDLYQYAKEKGNIGYAIHIKNLHIFDEPRFIRDYSKNENPYNYIENAPQNMMYAYDVKSFTDYEKYILISIRPQWLCKILNGEKTIEVRKVVLKEMLKNV